MLFLSPLVCILFNSYWFPPVFAATVFFFVFYSDLDSPFYSYIGFVFSQLVFFPVTLGSDFTAKKPWFATKNMGLGAMQPRSNADPFAFG